MKKLIVISILFTSCHTTYVWQAQRAVVYDRRTVNGRLDFKLCAIGKPVAITDSVMPKDSLWLLTKTRKYK